MKKSIGLIIAIILTIGSIAQTNYFPASGDVGIGTTSPGSKLSIGVSSNNYTQGLLFVDNNSQYPARIYYGSAGSSLSDWGLDFLAPTGTSTSITAFSLRGNGRVGIGTTNPSNKLSIGISSNNYTQGINFVDNTNQYPAGIYYGSAGSNVYDWGLDFVAPSSASVTTTVLSLRGNGGVGIGTTSPTEKLSVEGNIYANGNISANGSLTTKKLIVLQSGWSDYVFDKKYVLRSLPSLEAFVKQNKRLPDIPSAEAVTQNGIDIANNQALLLKKIEELTLYVIEQQKQLNHQAAQIGRLKKKSNLK